MRQRGSIVKPRGRRKRYAIKYRTPSGKQAWQGKFENREEARKKLTEVLKQIDEGRYVERKPITVGMFADQWIAKRLSVRGSTSSAYESVIRKQWTPRIGGIVLADLSLEHIQGAVNGMLADGRSAKTIHNAVTLLRTMLAGRKGHSAIRVKLINADPTLGLELPPLQTKQVTPPTPKEVWALIDAARRIGGLAYPLVYLEAFTGLRRNEMLALNYESINWLEKHIHVHRAVSKQKGTDGAHKWQWHIGPVKSRRSNRKVHLTESALRMLADLKRISRGSGLVFPAKGGSFIDPDMFDAEVFKPVADAAGMTLRFHDLRHFFASQLIAQGETPAYVRDQLGHSSIKVTFDVYGHLFPGAGEAASKRLEEAMAEAKPKPSEKPIGSTDGSTERISKC